MKYLLQQLSKHKDLLIVFIMSFFLCSPYLIDICSGYMNYYYFDLQEFLLWNYTLAVNLLPYKDIFYPYGLLSYFKNFNIIFELVLYLILPALFTVLYFLFKKIFKDRFILCSSSAIFYLFILNLVGLQTFGRYGMFVLFTLVISYIFYLNRKISLTILFYLGLLLGVFFSLVNDQGAYLIFFTTFTLIFGSYLQTKKNNPRQVLYLSLGFLTGVIPFFLFLHYLGNLSYFFSYLKDVSEIAVVAKTPFFSFIDSPANLFTITILYFALFYNFLKVFFYKHKLTLSSFFQITLIFDILLMEQKSMIRSIDRQITFITLILLMLLVYEILNSLKRNNINKRFLYIFFIIGPVIFYSSGIDRQKVDFHNLTKNYSLLIRGNCLANNIKTFSGNNPSYMNIVNFLKRQKDFNNKIFAFSTGDSVFYVLLNQKPPYYNAIFEGSSLSKQHSSIKYIQDNKIQYVTLNTRRESLQDAVPDYIRQSSLFRYILNNYYPITVIGDHIILKREKNNDFFSSDKLRQKKDYLNYLKDVNLSNIPYSEGFYKFDYLKNNNKIIESGDVNKINSFLKGKTFNSQGKVFVLIPDINYKPGDSVFITFQIKSIGSYTVHYNPCKQNKACVINLANIPIFYNRRIIANIILDNKFEGTIKIFDLKEQGNLW